MQLLGNDYSTHTGRQVTTQIWFTLKFNSRLIPINGSTINSNSAWATLFFHLGLTNVGTHINTIRRHLFLFLGFTETAARAKASSKNESVWIKRVAEQVAKNVKRKAPHKQTLWPPFWLTLIPLTMTAEFSSSFLSRNQRLLAPVRGITQERCNGNSNRFHWSSW